MSPSALRRMRMAALLTLLTTLGSSCPPAATAPEPDANGDGVVNSLDGSLVSSCIGEDPGSLSVCAAADVDHDGDVDGDDLEHVVANYGPLVCNGWEDLCDRTYDRVAYPTTHNAFANTSEGENLAPGVDGFIPYNQRNTMSEQLEDGVRAMMLDSWNFVVGSQILMPGSFLCHALCGLGFRPLADGLADIRLFLESNPHEVVTLIFENYISTPEMEQAFIDAGLLESDGSSADSLLFEHPTGASGDGWPTLREMIDTNKRLVVLTDSGGNTFPWYHAVFSLAFESSFSNPLNDGNPPWECGPNRGSAGNDLYILNHFISTSGGQPLLGEVANPNPVFLNHALECWTERGRIPNFITVDYYETGRLFEVVATLNWLADPN